MSIQPYPQDSSPLRQGWISLEELSPPQLERLGQPELPILLTLSGIGARPSDDYIPAIELRLPRATLVKLEQKIRRVLLASIGATQPYHEVDPVPRRGRISIEAIPPSHVQVSRPEHSIRMTFSGIQPASAGGCPPVIEVRLSRSGLAGLEAQIRAVRLASVVNAGRAARAEPLTRRTPGRALQEHFTAEQIKELHEDHGRREPVPTEDAVRFLNGLRRMEVTT
ncbi:hypothetical protein [Kitasatospora sp. NPDC127116]|uniref:hypothetical protein n=1 Tax=Kitasatospora sp. NPDC127116 TaxID=3345367 RepID=UPI0036403F18